MLSSAMKIRNTSPLPLVLLALLTPAVTAGLGSLQGGSAPESGVGSTAQDPDEQASGSSETQPDGTESTGTSETPPQDPDPVPETPRLEIGSEGAPADPESGEEVDERPEVERFFATCDHDRNGWISFREAQASLFVDRAAYAGFDTDRDGRVSDEEFETRYNHVVARTGSFRPPNELSLPSLMPRRSPAQLRAAYDGDANGTISPPELRRLLDDYGYDLPTHVVLERVDHDGSGQIELSEIHVISRLLSAAHLTQAIDEIQTELIQADSVLELFGTPEAPESLHNRTAAPPRIPGPVGHFARLDMDRDGGVTLKELEDLQRPSSLPVRTAAILATLDKNGDGRLDRAEFEASMRH